MLLEGIFFKNSDFTLMDEIGEGQYGKVYIVQKNDDEKLYAAKIFNCKSGIDGPEQWLILREALILNNIQHPSILKFLGINFQSIGGLNVVQPTIITEYLSNGSLKDIMDLERRHKPPSNWNSTKKYITLLGVSDAMRYLHEHGIIHRDMKPQNILMDENLYPKLCNFEQSRSFPDSFTDTIQLSKTGNFGTPMYLAPEMLND